MITKIFVHEFGGPILECNSYDDWVKTYLSFDEGTEIFCDMHLPNGEVKCFRTDVEHDTVTHPDLFVN